MIERARNCFEYDRKKASPLSTKNPGWLPSVQNFKLKESQARLKSKDDFKHIGYGTKLTTILVVIVLPVLLHVQKHKNILIPSNLHVHICTCAMNIWPLRFHVRMFKNILIPSNSHVRLCTCAMIIWPLHFHVGMFVLLSGGSSIRPIKPLLLAS